MFESDRRRWIPKPEDLHQPEVLAALPSAEIVEDLAKDRPKPKQLVYDAS